MDLVSKSCTSCGVACADASAGELCARCARLQSLGSQTVAPTEHATWESPRVFGVAGPGTPIFESDVPRGGAPDLAHRFGDYELRRELGRGGMGVVYEAVQVTLGRPVALKMMRSGAFAGAGELRRFQNEAQAVARLDHPFIVPIYEVGEHAGQCYFSMKLITGGSLLGSLARYGSDARAAARIVAEAADAVAHAHERGILHRDLKPANVLIDEAGHPHITDFGLAKQIDSDIEFTQSGAIVGTPAYMAPEQATGRRGTITTATDVYGLGGILYTVLTGKAPFSAETVVETLDAVRQRPPEAPRRVNSNIPRDLETICLKCLEKDPKRRYPTARALADDLQAWLNSRPISARRVRAPERAWLWCKRKPALAALAAAVIVALATGVVSVIAVQAASNRALASKNADLAAALGREAAANEELLTANRRVQERFALAMDAVKTFHTGVSEDLLLKEKNLTPLRKKLLESARNFYSRMEGQLQGKNDRESRAELARAYLTIAHLTQEIESVESGTEFAQKSLAIRRELAADKEAGPDAACDIAEALHEIGTNQIIQGRYADSLVASTEAADIAQALVTAHPTVERYKDQFGKALSNSGIALAYTGKPAEALAADRRTHDIYLSLVQSNPDKREYRESLSIAKGMIAALLKDRPAEAMALREEVLALNESLLASDPQNPHLRDLVAKACMNLGGALSSSQSARALALLQRAQSIWEHVSRENNTTAYVVNMAVASDSCAKRLCILGREEEELAAYRRELSEFEAAAAIDPSNHVFPREIADCCEHIALILSRTGRIAEAVKEIRRAISIREDINQHGWENRPDYVGFDCDLLGDLEEALGHHAESLAAHEKALAVWQGLIAANPSATAFKRAAAASLRELGRADEAAQAQRAALAAIQAITPQTPETSFGQARCRARLYQLSHDARSGVSESEGEAFAAQAVLDLRNFIQGQRASLAEALDSQYIDVDRIDKTLDLQPLRPRPDFQSLLAEVRRRQ
ncbi:MAG: protein kinase [Phycisphaerales bacterium]